MVLLNFVILLGTAVTASRERFSLPNFLVFTERDELQLIQPRHALSRSKNTTKIASGKFVDPAVDFCYKDGTVFYGDSVKNIRSFNTHTGEEKVPIEDVLVSSLAVDWISGKLYWITKSSEAYGNTGKDRIEVSDLNGAIRAVLFWENLQDSKALVLDPIRGFLYWIDGGISMEEPKIERGAMDGSDRTSLFSMNSDVYLPTSLTLDLQSPKFDPSYNTGDCDNAEHPFPLLMRIHMCIAHPGGILQANRLYWADGHNSELRIMYLDLQSLRIKSILNESGVPNSLTFHEGSLFWTEWETRGILACSISSCNNSIEVFNTGQRLDSVKVFSAQVQPSRPDGNPCRSNNGYCSHLCLISPKAPYYSCVCPVGVRLLEDGRTCEDGHKALLIFARRPDLRYISLDTKDYTDIKVPVGGIYTAVALDYDPVDDLIYWSDNDLKAIRRVKLDGSKEETIISREYDLVDGLAIDWLGRNLYWTDTGMDRIEVAHLDGSSRRVLISTDLKEPRSIVLDPKRGYMYWCDWGLPRIEKSYMDGSHRQTLIQLSKDRSRPSWPNGLALDIETQRIFWGDARQHNIESARASDGGDRKILVTKDVRHVFGLTLLNEYIFWTDWQQRYIMRAKKSDGSEQEIINVNPDLMGLVAVNLSRPLKMTNDCVYANGGCSHLCLMRPIGSVCACPVVLELAEDKKTCIKPKSYLLFTRQNTNDIFRLSLDRLERTHAESRTTIASGQSDSSNYYATALLLHGTRGPFSLDVDITESRVYWTDMGKRRIAQGYFNGTDVSTFVDSGADTIGAIAVDWLAKNLYWCDAQLLRIEVVSINNPKVRKAILYNGIKPGSIGIDPMNGYLFFTSLEATYSSTGLHRADLDAKNPVTLISDKQIYSFAVDVWTERIFFSNEEGVVFSTSYQGYGDTKVVVEARSNWVTLSLTVDSSNVYLADLFQSGRRHEASAGRIVKCPKSNEGDIGNCSLVHSETAGHIYSLAVVTSDKQTGWNPCVRENGGCSDLCFAKPDPNTQTKVRRLKAECGCPTHFTFDYGSGKCKPPTSFFLIASQREVSRIAFNGDYHHHHLAFGAIGAGQIFDARVHLPLQKWNSKETPALADQITQVRQMTYDPSNRIIYWLDSETRYVYWSTESGEKGGSIKMHPDAHIKGIALEPVSQVLYWSCQKYNSINVTSVRNVMLGTKPKHLGAVIAQNHYQPNDVVLNPQKGHLFFISEGQQNSEIIRCQLNGNGCQTVVKCVGFAKLLQIDPLSNLLFWVELNEQRWVLHRSSGDGREVFKVYDFEKLEPMSLSVFRHRLFMVIKNNERVFSIDKISGKDKSTDLERVRDLAAILATDGDITERVLNMSQKWCGNPVDGYSCDQLCIADSDEKFGCSCLPHMILSGNGRKCLPKKVCQKHELLCADGQACYDVSARCDEKQDCSDYSDEKNCEECMSTKGMFLCHKDHHCVSARLQCDGIKDCSDGSDEAFCRCAYPKTQFSCLKENRHVCISRDWLCDSHLNCDSGVDENHCSNPDDFRSSVGSEAEGPLSTKFIIIYICGAVVIVMVITFLLRYCRKNSHQQPEAHVGVRVETSQRPPQNPPVLQVSEYPVHHYPLQVNPSTSHTTVEWYCTSGSGAFVSSARKFVPPAPPAPPPSTTMYYDRSHVTGKSSSSSSAYGPCGNPDLSEGPEYSGFSGTRNDYLPPHPPSPASGFNQNYCPEGIEHIPCTSRKIAHVPTKRPFVTEQKRNCGSQTGESSTDFAHNKPERGLLMATPPPPYFSVIDNSETEAMIAPPPSPSCSRRAQGRAHKRLNMAPGANARAFVRNYNFDDSSPENEFNPPPNTPNNQSPNATDTDC